MGCLIFTETGIKGSVPGRVKLVVDDDQGQAQRLVVYGIQSRYYDSAASAALYYECEGRTPLGGSAVAAGPSGAGSNVMRQTGLLATPQAIMSTQATGAGAHLSHVGSFRVFLRAQVPASNAGAVSVALEWGPGDFRVTTLNATTEVPSTSGGGWVLCDMGTVHLEKVAQGTQRWEGRVNASSTVAGDDVDLDNFKLVPIDESYGQVDATYAYQTGIIVGRDNFAGMTAGAALGGRTAPFGGAWATSGGATDFVATTPAGSLLRSTGPTGADTRYAVLGSATYTDSEIGVFLRHEEPGSVDVTQGVIGRWVDANNHLALLRLSVVANSLRARVVMRIAGTSFTLANVAGGHIPGNTLVGLRLIVFSTGTGIAQVLSAAGTVLATERFSDPALAAGGVLATGKVGIKDENLSASFDVRIYDDFYAATPAAEPLAIAPSRSLELRSDRAIRQDAGGTLWQGVLLEGFYPRVPPAWLEGRTARFLVMDCRGPKLAPRVWADPAIDDISARLTYTPQFLNLPEA